jgi:integrase
MKTEKTKTVVPDFLSGSPTTALLDQQIDMITAGLSACYNRNLRKLKNQENVSTIVKYIQTMKTETNVSDLYRRETINVLRRFSLFVNEKSFGDIIREDVLAFLDSIRKLESMDQLHKWIGTYNLYRMYLMRFLKWLHSPNIEYKKRSTPAIMQNIPLLKRRETSIYKPSDLWTTADDLLFLKYCPNKRDRCYHAVSRDLSCRPAELLRLKIRDVVFKTINGSQYAETTVNGKTGTRPIPLINSLPCLKDYLDHDHPMPSNPNAPLICGTMKSLGKHLTPVSISHIYNNYKKRIFPYLLDSPNVPPEEKKLIAELLKKPWNPYIRRHSALTEKSMILKEHVLRQHAGWTPGSQMHLKYLHYFGNESSESLLEAYGVVDHGIQIDQLRPKQCPNCSEPNKPDSKFCAKCRMVLSYDAYEETVDKQEKEDAIATLSDQLMKVMQEIETLKRRRQT